MPNTTKHVCKFDASHGVFPTPVVLRQHYDSDHAGQYDPRKWGSNTHHYACRLCGVVVRNPSSHFKGKHAVQVRNPQLPMATHYFDRLPDDYSPGDPTPTRAVDVLARHAVRQSQPKPPASVNGHDLVHDEPTTVPRHVGPWTVDDIVLPVVEQLAGPRAVVPVAHLAAILAWRDATAVMLATVTR